MSNIIKYKLSNIKYQSFMVFVICLQVLVLLYFHTALILQIHETGKLPVVNFAAGGIATPADAALMMQIGVEGVFVGSGIFKSSNPSAMAKAIVKATTHFNDPKIIAEVSSGLGDAMRGLDVRTMPEEEQLATRGW